MAKSNKSLANRSKMVKKILIISGIIFLGGLFYTIKNTLTSDGIKSIYCLSNDKCVTVWKRANGEVYVIPDKYEGNSKPSVCYIKTINKQFLTIYFSEEISKKIIVRDDGNLESNQRRYTIENKGKGKWDLLEYSQEYKSILYKSNAIKFKDVKSGTEYLTINIHENYAIDKTGKKIK
jgi:hypothetical protein